eukprot:GGOE01038379.1.p1 GENE.GGOE01038379.1~~GGOE01038379.1.p1  ORF type:complete len:410 (-),score=85.77 GGOE01038379.1:299-1528(-)
MAASSSSSYRAMRWTCPRPSCSGTEDFALTSYDLHAFHTFAPITLGYRFPVALDPARLCQSLSETLVRFPAFSGCITKQDGHCVVQTWVHTPAITAVEVPQDVLLSPHLWHTVAEEFSIRTDDVGGAVLFQALLLHSIDSAAGCVLLVAVDHAVADATTCAILLSTWSRLHRVLFGSCTPCELAARLPDDFQQQEQLLLVRRFHFPHQRLAALKTALNAAIDGLSPPVTGNDVLLAVCACAAATAPDSRHITRTTPQALIVMVADPRGRGLPEYFMGNAARPIPVRVDWAPLTSGDLEVAAMAVHRAIRESLAALQSADLHEAPAVAEKPFLQWNSWLRVPGLLEVDFESTLCEFDWVSVRTLRHSHQFVAFPVTTAGGCALQVALPAASMAHFIMEWDRSLGPETWET